MSPDGYSYDVFISHASEDKDRFVRPLAEALRNRGVTVWYDEWELEVGDSLVEKINDGLSRARYGVVVLSPGFFSRNWPKAELDSLAAQELREGRRSLLPIWLDLGADEIASYAPLLLARVALLAAEGLEAVADKLTSKVQGGQRGTPPQAPPPPRTLYPLTVAAQALPNSYSQPLASDESGFVFRTVVALGMPVGQDQHLNSQQKRAFQAIMADSTVERLLQSLVHSGQSLSSSVWGQAQPNSGTVATIARPPESMRGREGTLGARSGLVLKSYLLGDGQVIVHLDVVLRPPREMRRRCLLSFDDFYSLLLVPGASLRNEIAPVVAALLAGSEEPALVAQSAVAVPNSDSFSTYLDLSQWALDRVPDASGPYAVHWNANSTSDVETPGAWKAAVIQMIDRLFSDGGFLDYEHSLARLGGGEAGSS